MTSGGAARRADRLPWLSDKPQQQGYRWSRELVAWAVLAAMLISAISYRAGQESRAAANSAKESDDTSSAVLPEPYSLAPAASNTVVPSGAATVPDVPHFSGVCCRLFES